MTGYKDYTGYIKVIKPFKTKANARKRGELRKRQGLSKSYRVKKGKGGYYLYQKPIKPYSSPQISYGLYGR